MPVWDRAEKAAAASRLSVSQLASAALRRYLPILEQNSQSYETITVEMRNDDGRRWSEGFRGRWLIPPDDDNRGAEDAGACYGIALTAKGQIAVYCYHVNDRWPPRLDVYDNLDDAQSEDHGLPEELIAAAGGELGEQRVIWRDI